MNFKSNEAVSIGRNDTCLCGSGKKYKKCCLDLQRIEEQENRLQHNMFKKMKTDFPGSEMILSTSEELGIEKMSEVILEFADDMLRQSDTRQEERKAIEVAIVAWNISFMDKASQEKAINEFTHSIVSQRKQEFKMLIELLLDKKKTHYSSINRLIINYEILDTPDGSLHLNVASNLISH